MLRMKDLVRPLFRSPVARAGPPGGRRTRLGVAQLEDRTVPSVSVSVATLPGSPNEWGDTGKFRFTRSGGPISSALTVNTTVEGTAGAGDYSGPGGSVVFPANVSQVDVTVTVTDDSIPEPDETVQVRILSGLGYNVGSPDRAQVSIGDNDSQLTFSLGAYQGAIGYTVPWDQVDASKSSQSIALPDFQLNLAGQMLPSGATVVTSPTIQFAAGEFIGVTFAFDTSTIAGYPFNSVAMAGMTVTAVLRSTGTTVNATAVMARDGAKLDFSDVPVGKAFSIVIDIKASVNGMEESIEKTTLTFAATETVADVTDAIAQVFEDAQVEVEVLAGNKLRFMSKKKFISSIEFTFKDANQQPIAGGLKLLARYGPVVVKQNDTTLNPS